ncbi:MAG: hypothetical protein LC708_04195, partial [Actinobacteria bacterium]|nr:hypothetical protein [Actinomycetota bacterium]
IHLSATSLDNYVVVFNEQIVNPDGSRTVNAVHQYFGYVLDGSGNRVVDAGSTLKGDMILGQSVCGATLAPPPHDNMADFDGDGDTDISIYRPSNGGWYSNDGFTAQYGGQSGDIAVPGDYDDDGKTDTAIYRPSVGTWYIHNSATNTDTLLNYGVGSDIPVPADYTGDGRTEVAIYRPSTPTNLAGGTWYIRNLANGTDTIVTFGGIQGDIPVVGDYDGDGKSDRAIFRPSSGGWFVQQSSGGDTARTYGQSGDIPVPGDYDDDGKTDVGVYRPAVGTWFVNNSGTGTDTLLNYGVATDQVQPSDYNGDGRTEIAIYRPTTPTNLAGGTWYIRNLANGTDTIVTFGGLQG